MIGDITVDRIANSIMQRRKKYENFILVEGSHDYLLILKFKNEGTQVEITFGWEKLVEIIANLKSKGFEKAIGIIDRDLRDLVPENTEFVDEIILTDEHDINIMSLEKSFEIVFKSYCSPEKVENFKQEKKNNCIKSYTHNIVRPLSYLKILNKRENLNLVFKTNNSKKNRFDYSKFIDKEKYELISLEKLVETITNFSRGKTDKQIIDNHSILKKLTSIMQSETHENTKLNSGHDFGEFISICLKKRLGTFEVDGETFLKETILAYDSSDFKLTSIFKNIKKLEVAHQTAYLRH